jgi:hypothetical protein
MFNEQPLPIEINPCSDDEDISVQVNEANTHDPVEVSWNDINDFVKAIDVIAKEVRLTNPVPSISTSENGISFAGVVSTALQDRIVSDPAVHSKSDSLVPIEDGKEKMRDEMVDFAPLQRMNPDVFVSSLQVISIFIELSFPEIVIVLEERVSGEDVR